MPLPPHTPELAILDLMVSVAETGSLGRAAARHGISQPAASQRLRRLERQLGLPLLVRSPSGSRLTPAGEAFVGWARRVLDEATRLADGVQALRGATVDLVQVAASLTIADSLVPGWLATLRQDRPGTRVSLRVGNSAAVVDLVLRQAVALGFIEAPSAPAGLRSRTVGGDRLLVVVRPGHAWARRRTPLPLGILADTPLTVREPGSGTREALEQALARAGLRLQPLAELGSTAALKAAALTGAGPAVLSELSVADELAAGRLHEVPVAGADLRRRFRAVWHSANPPAGAALALLAAARRPAEATPRRPAAPTGGERGGSAPSGDGADPHHRHPERGRSAGAGPLLP
ncbi:MAG TPA: LysR family transcriptional regulator [Jatrophihabitans sp.]|nr:LysR family transcriptional regulator [Jatrophihabitans sp.]